MDRVVITWTVFIAISFCYGLASWGSVQIRRSQQSHGMLFGSDLPPIVLTPTFRVLALIGQLGILIAPWMVLSHGILWVILVALALYIAGTAMGAVMVRAVDAIVERGIGS